jgi:hypothetical protein
VKLGTGTKNAKIPNEWKRLSSGKPVQDTCYFKINEYTYINQVRKIGGYSLGNIIHR